jgi:hypothetical protein
VTAVRSSERRPVRVTIEGEAYSPAGGVLIVVRKDGGKIVFPSAAAGVTVEDIVPPRVWTDGDVVQHSTDTWTLTRERGQWLSTRQPDQPDYWTDDMVTKALRDNRNGWGRLVALRYQHGGDA